MRELLEPKSLKLKVKKSTPKRERYWERHGGRPDKVHRKAGNVLNILATVAALGSMSDTTVAQERAENLVRNLAFVEHEQRLRGALARLKRQNPFMLKIPPLLERQRVASAFKSQEEKRKS